MERNPYDLLNICFMSQLNPKKAAVEIIMQQYEEFKAVNEESRLELMVGEVSISDQNQQYTEA
jgi:hypothetical protein